MARIAFHYFPGNSSLHHWDARCKFFGLLMITATLLQSRVTWLIFDSTLLMGLLILSIFVIFGFGRSFFLPSSFFRLSSPQDPGCLLSLGFPRVRTDSVWEASPAGALGLFLAFQSFLPPLPVLANFRMPSSGS